MNVVSIPYHDWRKIETEGARTRDAHVMHHLSLHKSVSNLIIVNRPITYTEILLRKKPLKIKGTVVFNNGGGTLYKIKNGVYLFDYISKDLFGPLTLKKKWFIKSFGSEAFYNCFMKAIASINITIDITFTQNIFSAPFVRKFKNTLFDAWDNFILFPENQVIKEDLKSAYQSLADNASKWVTNSQKNVDFYNKNYGLNECTIIKNGVDVELFNRKYPMPSDLENLTRPVIGFGGKITHLFNYDLFNKVVNNHPDKSFVIVGQILDKEVFSKINMAPNVHYLGDKNYQIYPSYVTNFNIGIIPYVTNHLEHGADSIKVYEYIAAGLGVVGTAGAGMTDMSSYMNIAKNETDFSEYIDKALNEKRNVQIPPQHTWGYKVDQLVNLFSELLRS
jgi:teichuronic acid biosynthesis glycosyltransferase TuaH